MSFDFELKIGPKDMSRFLLRYNYTKMAGLLGILLGVAAIIGLALRFEMWSDSQRMMLIAVALLFLVFQPIVLVRKAKAQWNQTKDQEPLMCHMDEQHILVRQGEAESSCDWKNVRKIVFGKGVVYVFTTAIHATIITEKSCEEQFEELVAFLKEKRKR